jgi:hypothetical protein
VHNEELHNLYSSANIIITIKSRMMREAGHVARVGRYRVLVGKPEGKRQTGSPKLRWEDTINMDLR